MEPIDEFINRSNSKNEIYYQLLNDLGNCIEEIVNFGSNIVSWIMQIPQAKDDEIPCLLFLRNFLDELDGISILIKYSSIDTCNNLLRTALENFFYIEYILEKNSYDRSMSFFVWNTFRNKKLYHRFDGISKEYKLLLTSWQKDKFLKNSQPIVIPDLAQLKIENKNLLDHPMYKPYTIEYERTKKTIPNPEWYSLFDGPKNIQELANNLNYQIFYEILYRNWSASAHGTNILDGKASRTNDNKLALYQIRMPNKKCIEVTQYCFNLSLIIFKSIINKKFPDRIETYNQWYLKESKFILSLSDVKITKI